MSTDPVSVRAVSRNAVREELARVAFNRFCATGFDTVTFADLAGATGVSRSTFLRYFANKEDVVLFVFDPVGDIVAEAIRADQERTDDWDALRQAFGQAIEVLVGDAQEVLAFLDLICATPALSAHFREKQFQWRDGIVRELLGGPAEPSAVVAATVRVAAAAEAFSFTLERWRESAGKDDPVELLGTAFSALSLPRAN